MSDEKLPPKRVSESRVVLSMMMNPAHANALLQRLKTGVLPRSLV